MKHILFAIAFLSIPAFAGPAWSCAAYCNYTDQSYNEHTDMEVADGDTMSLAMQALAAQCATNKGTLIGGSVAGAVQQSSAYFRSGLVSAKDACQKN